MKALSTGVLAAAAIAIVASVSIEAQGGKPKKLAAVPLSVVIESTTSAGVAARITDDGQGAYVDGVGGTAASIDQHGNLIIRFGRQVGFDYGERIEDLRDPGVTDEPVSGWYSTSYISSLNSRQPPLQDLVEGQQQCIKLNWQRDLPGGGWLRLGFNRGPDDTLRDTTSYAVVTRDDQDMWRIEPASGVTCNTNESNASGPYGNPDATALVFTQVSTRGRWVYTFYGTYRLPFRLTLTRKTP